MTESITSPDVHINLNVRGMRPSATVAINERCNELLAAGREIYKLGLGQSPFPVPEPVVERFSLEVAQVPVNRSVFDRILFRPVAKIREQLFGGDGVPDKPITAAKKRKRLAERGFMELHGMIDAFLERSFPAPQCRYVEEHAGSFIEQGRHKADSPLLVLRILGGTTLEVKRKRNNGKCVVLNQQGIDA